MGRRPIYIPNSVPMGSSDISALNAFTSSYFIDSASFSSSIEELEGWSSSFSETQGLPNVLLIHNETSGSDIVVSEDDVIDFKANNVSVMLFSGSEDIAYGNYGLIFRDFESISLSSGSGASQSDMIKFRKISNVLSDILIGNNSGVDGELSIFNSSNPITYRVESLTNSRSIHLPNSDINWTGSVDNQVMAFNSSSNIWEPKSIIIPDISALNTFTSSYFIDSASFSSSIEELELWSGSLIIPDISALNTFSQSALITVASINSSLSTINTFTSSYFIDSASFSSSIEELELWSGSLIIPDISALNTFTSSYFIDSASFSSSIEELELWSGSLIIPDISALNTFSQSALITVASINSSLSTINTFTSSYFIDSASFSSSIEELELWSGSLDFITSDITGSSLTTASVNLNTITFTKGNSDTFNIIIDTGSRETYSIYDLNDVNGDVKYDNPLVFVGTGTDFKARNLQIADIVNLSDFTSSIFQTTESAFPANPTQGDRVIRSDIDSLEFMYESSSIRLGWYSTETFEHTLLSTSNGFFTGSAMIAINQRNAIGIPSNYDYKLVGVICSWYSTTPGGIDTEVNLDMKILNDAAAGANSINIINSGSAHGFNVNDRNDVLNGLIQVSFDSIKDTASPDTDVGLADPLVNLRIKRYYAS